VPGGSLKNSPPADIVVTAGQIIGWESNTKIGVYTPISGSGLSDNKYVGLRTLIDGTVTFTETAQTYNNETCFYSSTKAIWYDNTNWILSSAPGVKTEPYWQSADLIGTYVIEGSGTPASYSINVSGYVEGTEYVNFATGQVALWL
jgi:hypothetical protein